MAKHLFMVESWKEVDGWLKIRVQCPESELDKIQAIRSRYINSYDYYINSFSKMGNTWFLDFSAQMKFKPGSGLDDKTVADVQEQFLNAHSCRLQEG